MSRREVAFFKLPDIYDVPVKDQNFWLYTVKIDNKFICMTPVSSQMHIGNNGYLQFSLPQFLMIFMLQQSYFSKRIKVFFVH